MFWEFKVGFKAFKVEEISWSNRVDQNPDCGILVFRSTGGIGSGRPEPARKRKKRGSAKMQGGIFGHHISHGLPSDLEDVPEHWISLTTPF